MKDEHKYYTLRFTSSDHYHKSGEVWAASSDVVRIGQQSGNEICLPNHTPYTDELFAVIRPGKCAGSWVLIPVSEYVHTLVNGTSVSIAHYLCDGDRITFEDCKQELVFHVRNDEKYHAGMRPQMITSYSHKLTALFILLPIILFAFLGHYIYQENRERRVWDALLEEAGKSVYQLSVDSVYYVEITSSGSKILRHFSYVAGEGKSINGTAFLTTDSFLVTARHCLEPWLNDKEILKGNPDEVTSIPVRWALEAETYNQTHSNDTLYRVISLCALSHGDKAIQPVEQKWKSSDFTFDTEKDDIISMGDYTHDYYWRSIQRRNARYDMMLGDLAYLSYPDKGAISKASIHDMKDFVKERNRIYMMGYPEYQVSGLEFSEGLIKRNYDSLEMIAHNGQLIYGYSGGPVMVIHHDSIYVVGVISVIDAKGGDRMYSVPITQWKSKKGGADE